MVLDPFTAVGFAGNIVQFLDFSFKVISKGRKGYNSALGIEAEYVELETIAKHLQQLATSLHFPKDNDQNILAPEHEAFEKLRQSCLKVASELIQAIDQVKVKAGSHRRWDSFQQALIIVWKKEKFDELRQRLDGLRQEINLHML